MKRCADAPGPRSTFLLDGAGAVLGLPLCGDKQAPGEIGAVHVRAVTKAVTTLYAHDHDHGSAPLRQAAADALHTAYQWLQSGTYTSRTEAKLRSATGALSIAAGWLSYDSGRAGDAHSLYGEALAAARIADDPELEAHAFGCLSLLAKASGRPRESISAAQGAQSVARSLGSPRRLLSLFHMREAGGWALMGDAGATDPVAPFRRSWAAHAREDACQLLRRAVTRVVHQAVPGVGVFQVQRPLPDPQGVADHDRPVELGVVGTDHAVAGDLPQPRQDPVEGPGVGDALIGNAMHPVRRFMSREVAAARPSFARRSAKYWSKPCTTRKPSGCTRARFDHAWFTFDRRRPPHREACVREMG